MPTVEASLAARIPFVNRHQRSPVPRSFVLQLTHEFTPAHIVNGFRQRRMLDHPLDLQTLDADRLVLTNQACRELVREITAAISDTSMDTSDLETSLVSVFGTL